MEAVKTSWLATSVYLYEVEKLGLIFSYRTRIFHMVKQRGGVIAPLFYISYVLGKYCI